MYMYIDGSLSMVHIHVHTCIYIYTCTYTCSVAGHGIHFVKLYGIDLVDSPTDMSSSFLPNLSPSPSPLLSLPHHGSLRNKCQTQTAHWQMRQETEDYRNTVYVHVRVYVSAGSRPCDDTNHEHTTDIHAVTVDVKKCSVPVPFCFHSVVGEREGKREGAQEGGWEGEKEKGREKGCGRRRTRRKKKKV